MQIAYCVSCVPRKTVSAGAFPAGAKKHREGQTDHDLKTLDIGDDPVDRPAPKGENRNQYLDRLTAKYDAQLV